MKKSVSWDTRKFARVLWQGSIENTGRLKWVLTKTEPYVVLPTRVSTRYMFLIDELVAVGSEAFDRRFISKMTASLRESLAIAERYARTGDDLGLKEFAATSVPKIRMQLDRILEIEMQHDVLAFRR